MIFYLKSVYKYLVPFLRQLPSVSWSCWSGYKLPSDRLADQTAKQEKTFNPELTN